jgi:ADP-ribose pyrophosphatase YjhB (NUDIX family)
MAAPDLGSHILAASNAEVDCLLPRRRCSTGVLLVDGEGRLLLVKPAYRDEWLVPGGVVEPNETPAQAALRELIEETGIEAHLTGLVCVDAVPAHHGFSESIHFLFSAKAAPDALAKARADGKEIIDVAWIDLDEARRRVPASLARRLATVQSGAHGYFENGDDTIAIDRWQVNRELTREATEQ